MTVADQIDEIAGAVKVINELAESLAKKYPTGKFIIINGQLLFDISIIELTKTVVSG